MMFTGRNLETLPMVCNIWNSLVVALDAFEVVPYRFMFHNIFGIVTRRCYIPE